jgi:hypothetical protein
MGTEINRSMKLHKWSKAEPHGELMFNVPPTLM